MNDQKDATKQKKDLDDLSQLKAMVAQADSGGFTLDDILSEYGSTKRPAQTKGPGGKVVDFPTAARRPQPVSPPSDEDEELLDEELLDEGAPEEAPESEEGPPDDLSSPQSPDDTQENIIHFPEEESVLGAFLKRLGQRADHYADHMFDEAESLDPEEVRRIEELVPGTDREEPVRYARPRRRPDPPPPDTPPQELARTYAKGLKGLRLRSLGVLLLGLCALYLSLVPSLSLPMPTLPGDGPQLQVLISVGLLGLGMLLGIDVLIAGLGRAFRLKVGMDTILALACLATVWDGLLLSLSPLDRGGQLPYCAVDLIALFFLMHGAYHKRCAQRLSCRTAAAAKEPYLVTLDEGLWSGRDTYTKWSGSPEGFGSQIQTDDGAQRIYRRTCPLLLLGCVLFALIASVGVGQSQALPWSLSATLTAASSLGAGLAYGRSSHKLERRLGQSGATLAGWPGLAQSRRGDRVLLTDGDLFPPGYVELNGIKVFGDFPLERVVSYTATLIRESGSGLAGLFHGILRSYGAIFRRTEGVSYYEGGGMSATIRGEQVLVGSASFMNLMEVALPSGLNVKQAVFCAIDGELAALFALNYNLPDTVFPAISALLREKVGPVLATRDCNLLPAMLQQRFRLAADKMDFPPIERRRELSDPAQPHGQTLTAVLCREGVQPFAEAIVGARRLRLATRLGAAVCCVSAALGIALAAYLTSAQAYSSISPLNLLIFLITWLLPVWFLTDWAHRY